MPNDLVLVAAAAAFVGSLATAASAQPAQHIVGTEESSCIAKMERNPPFHTYFPPIGANMTTWFRDNVPDIPAADPSMTAEEAEYVSWAATDFIAKRRAGQVTCEAYARALTKRAKHLRTMNQFMNWDNDPEWPDRVVEAATKLDAKAAEHGIESLAPLYCLPLPAKGTMATVDFKSSAGVGVLHNYSAKKDCAIISRVKDAGGVVFGKTNVPEFAASLVTCNYANGCTVNPHDPALSPGGSSGGSGSAVASMIAPVALTEDTGGSTRNPAFQNGNFGYDPTRGHFDNEGNPGMALILDQIGLNARTMDDIILVDAALSGYTVEDVYPNPKKATQLRVGVPLYPFVKSYVPKGGDNPFGYPEYPQAFMPSAQQMQKYDDAKAALANAGVTLVEAEWPAGDGSSPGVNVLAEALFLQEFNGAALSMNYHVFHTYMGQVSQWVNDYLGVDISIDDIVKDAHPAGAGHDPAGFMLISSSSSEAALQFIMQELRARGVAAWNRLFDDNDLDVIMVPAFLHAASMQCMAASTCEHQVTNIETGQTETEAGFTSLHNLFMHSLSHKHIPFGKVMVPTGLDNLGRPTGLQFMKRSGPERSVGLGFSYDSNLLKTIDVEFLVHVKTLVETMTMQDPSLQRVDAKYAMQ